MPIEPAGAAAGMAEAIGPGIAGATAAAGARAVAAGGGYYGGRWGYGGGWGWPFAGALAGAAVAAVASSYPYNYGYSYPGYGYLVLLSGAIGHELDRLSARWAGRARAGAYAGTDVENRRESQVPIRPIRAPQRLIPAVTSPSNQARRPAAHEPLDGYNAM
jgi:hypothetical protein